VTASTTAVVICAYTTDRWHQLVAAVESALAQTSPAEEIVVVVDHNPRLLTMAADLPATVVENTGSRGLSGARNSGVAAVRAEVTAFLDDDAAADPGWLAALTGPYADPNVVGVGGDVRPVWQGGRPRWFPAEFDWVVGCSHRGLPTTLAPVRNPIGANMSFRTAAIRDAGGFAEHMGRIGTLPVGCEETELAIRIARRQRDAQIMHQPAAVVHHQVPSVRGRWRYFRSRCWAEGLSKAQVAQLADPRRALAAERVYATRTLPVGVVHGLRDAVRQRQIALVGRALAIVAGLAITTAGYGMGRLRTVRRRPATDPGGGRTGSIQHASTPTHIQETV
jgi:cellulose synthase/poly-beta-1,6-N-acetylglucosamine synthase-like glycosyltransferase